MQSLPHIPLTFYLFIEHLEISFLKLSMQSLPQLHPQPVVEVSDEKCHRNLDGI